MKKILSLATLVLAAVFVLVACGKSSSKSTTSSSSAETAQSKTIKVAVHTAPMTDMLEAVKDDLKKEAAFYQRGKGRDNYR